MLGLLKPQPEVGGKVVFSVIFRVIKNFKVLAW